MSRESSVGVVLLGAVWLSASVFTPSPFTCREERLLRRGDLHLGDQVSLSDPAVSIERLFGGGRGVSIREDAGDMGDSAEVNLTDVVNLLPDLSMASELKTCGEIPTAGELRACVGGDR